MKGLLVVVAVVALEALSLSQPVKPPSTHRRPTDDPHCSHLKFQSTRALPSYDGPGFSTVEYSSPRHWWPVGGPAPWGMKASG